MDASYAIPVTWVTQSNAAPHQNTMGGQAVNGRYWRSK